MTRLVLSRSSHKTSAETHQNLPGFREFCEKSQILDLLYPSEQSEVQPNLSEPPNIDIVTAPGPENRASDSRKQVELDVSIRRLRKTRKGWFDDSNCFVKWVLDELEGLPDEFFSGDACFEMSDANSWGENHMSNQAAKNPKRALKNGTPETNSNHPALERIRRRFHHVFNRELYHLRPQWVHDVTQKILPGIKRKVLLQFPEDFGDVENTYQGQDSNFGSKANSRPGKNESCLEPIVLQIVMAIVLLSTNERLEVEREARIKAEADCEVERENRVRVEREATLRHEHYLEIQRLYDAERRHRMELEKLYGEQLEREEHRRNHSGYARSQGVFDEPRGRSSFFTQPNNSSITPLTPAASPRYLFERTLCESCDTSDQEDRHEVAIGTSAKRRRRESSQSSSFVLVERPRYRH